LVLWKIQQHFQQQYLLPVMERVEMAARMPKAAEVDSRRGDFEELIPIELTPIINNFFRLSASLGTP